MFSPDSNFPITSRIVYIEPLILLINSVAPIQQFAYIPTFHNPNCLYGDPIRYCLCEIYGCIYLVYNCSQC